MASKAVVDAVEARLAGGWSRCPVIGLNQLGDPPADGSAYLIVQYPFSRESHVGLGEIGRRTFREEGAFRLVLHAPRGQGLGQWLAWIDELRALFRAAQFGGISCLAPSPATIDDGNDNGSYVLLSCAVPYYTDIQA